MTKWKEEIPFSIPVTGSISVENDKVTIEIKPAVIILDIRPRSQRFYAEGKTIYDIMLETARSYVKEVKTNSFKGAQLLKEARIRYPEIKRSTWTSIMIAVTPSHPSNQHFRTRRNFFNFLGEGTYSLREELMEQ